MPTCKSLFRIIVLPLCGLMVGFAAFAQTTMPSNHVTRLGEADVDWTAGVMTVTGFGKMKDSSAQSRLNALRAAEMTAMSKALRAVLDIPVDSANRIGEQDRFKVRVQGRIRGAKSVAQRKVPGGMEVDLVIPLGGMDGLVKEILTLKTGAIRTKFVFHGDDLIHLEEPSWVYLDARGLDLTEALLPKIMAEDGTVLFDPGKTSNSTSPESMVYMEMASDTAHKAGTDHWTARPEVLKVALLAQSKGDNKSAGKAKRKRGGPRGHSLKGKKASGKIPADIVLDKSAAEKLKNDPKLAQAVREGRVVIVTDTKVGGTRGRRLLPPKNHQQMALLH